MIFFSYQLLYLISKIKIDFSKISYEYINIILLLKTIIYTYFETLDQFFFYFSIFNFSSIFLKILSMKMQWKRRRRKNIRGERKEFSERRKRERIKIARFLLCFLWLCGNEKKEMGGLTRINGGERNGEQLKFCNSSGVIKYYRNFYVKLKTNKSNCALISRKEERERKTYSEFFFFLSEDKREKIKF